MKKTESTITYDELPDTITPLDYAKWRGIGGTKAREIFNSKDFPRIKGVGVKQIADKRAVLFYDLGLQDNKDFMKELAKEII